MTSGIAGIAGDLAPTGVLRAAINLGNPVLAQGTAEEPSGVTVDIAREVGARLGVPVELVCFDAARKSFEAMVSGRTDICFLAIEPARAAEVAFTEPYLVIEGVYVVPEESSFTTPAEVDQPGVRIGVKEGSAYDLFLSRKLQHATVVRGEEGVAVFRAQRLDAGAGIRQPVTEFAAAQAGVRVIPERFMEIRQAVGIALAKRPQTMEFLNSLLEGVRANGRVERSAHEHAHRREAG